MSDTKDTKKQVSTVFKQGFKSYSPDDIKTIRSKLCLNQEEFGLLLFVEKATVSKWERGDRLPSTPVMRLMQFVEVMAEEKDGDLNHRIRKAYR